MRGQEEQKARWKRVLGAIEDQAGEALGQRYVEVAFPPESKARMEQLVRNLRAALKTRIEDLAWMSPETRAKELENWAARQGVEWGKSGTVRVESGGCR